MNFTHIQSNIFKLSFKPLLGVLRWSAVTIISPATGAMGRLRTEFDKFSQYAIVSEDNVNAQNIHRQCPFCASAPPTIGPVPLAKHHVLNRQWSASLETTRSQPYSCKIPLNAPLSLNGTMSDNIIAELLKIPAPPAPCTALRRDIRIHILYRRWIFPLTATGDEHRDALSCAAECTP